MAEKDILWSASPEQLAEGYIYDEESETYNCLICQASFVRGVIYPIEGVLNEAERAIQQHIVAEHSSMFEYLINMNKRYTGLTDNQQAILKCFWQGLSDQEIVKKLGLGSASTVRNYRFKLREREKQAKIFLSIMSLIEDRAKRDDGQEFVPIHRRATMIDDRYAITEEEREKVLKTFFQADTGELLKFPSREKRKIIVLQKIVADFKEDCTYSEKEVNDVIIRRYSDYVTIRRYLIEYGFMDRSKDGSSYWRTV